MNLNVPLLLVALLVITGGCTDLLGGAGGGPSADGSPTPSAAGNGPAAAGGGDVTLVENRTAVLREAGSYTSVWGMTITQDGEVAGETTYTNAIDYANERSSLAMSQTTDGEVQTAFENFYADGTSYTHYSEDGSYAVNDGAAFTPDRSLFSPTLYTHTASDLEDYSTVGTENYDGVTVTRYERTDTPSWLAQQGRGENVTWQEFTFTVLVDDDGLVRYEGWSATGVDQDGASIAFEYSYALTDVGSTVIEDPDWLDAARDQA